MFFMCAPSWNLKGSRPAIGPAKRHPTRASRKLVPNHLVVLRHWRIWLRRWTIGLRSAAPSIQTTRVHAAGDIRGWRIPAGDFSLATTILLLALIPLIGATSHGADLDDAEAADQGVKQEIAAPRLITSTPECFVHALHAPLDAAGDRFLRRPSSTSVAVLWTARASGEMKPLLGTGTFAIPTRRRSFTQTRLLGAVADEERLYLAVWRSGRTFDEPPPAADEPMDWTPPESTSRRDGAIGFALVVCWLADSSPLLDEPLPPQPQVSRETTADGLLRLIDGGVEFAGRAYKFRGRELVREN